VLYFSNGAFVRHADYEPLSKGIAEMLIAELAASPHLQVVERDRLQQLLAEQDLGAAGRLDPATAARIGRILGARYMLTGGFVIDGKDRMRLDLRAVDVETSAVEYVESVRGKAEDALDLISELGGRVVSRLRLPPTPRAGRPASGRGPERAARLRALMLMSRGLYEKDRGELAAAAGYFRQALEADPGFERAQVLLASVR
jgi:TolB-like protein